MVNTLKSGQSLAYARDELGYKPKQDTNLSPVKPSEGGLGSNKKTSFYEYRPSSTCTDRPSLPPKGGISRNKVGVMEIVPRISLLNF